jgi:hypothetical protein
MLSQLNWAEELHDALGEHIKDVVRRKAQVERFLEKRAKTQK